MAVRTVAPQGKKEGANQVSEGARVSARHSQRTATDAHSQISFSRKLHRIAASLTTNGI